MALECGFDLAGVTPALPLSEAGYYQQWVQDGYAGEMRYLVDHRAEVRNDPRRLLASARSILCVGKLYDGPQPDSPEMAAISRYAWGEDYHDVLREGLERLVARHPADNRRRFRVEDLRGYRAAAGAGLCARTPGWGGSARIPA